MSQEYPAARQRSHIHQPPPPLSYMPSKITLEYDIILILMLTPPTHLQGRCLPLGLEGTAGHESKHDWVYDDHCRMGGHCIPHHITQWNGYSWWCSLLGTVLYRSKLSSYRANSVQNGVVGCRHDGKWDWRIQGRNWWASLLPCHRDRDAWILCTQWRMSLNHSTAPCIFRLTGGL